MHKKFYSLNFLSRFFLSSAVLASAILSLNLVHASDTPQPVNKALNETVFFAKNSYGLFSTSLETTLYKPDGDGPFPLVVINHGKEEGNPKFQKRARYPVAGREFVRRGYVVVMPMRGGFSNSTGNYIGSGCNVESNGQEQAEDVRAVLDHVTKLPFVDAQRIIVMGQSHGGLTTTAFGTRPYPGVLGLINFAGGLKNTNCGGWEANLVRAFGAYGRNNHYPMLWLYGDNDSYFPRPLVDQMYASYSAAGGLAKLVAYGRFKGDSHALFGDRDGFKIWWPEVRNFLQELNLPTALLPRPERSDDLDVQRLIEAELALAAFSSSSCKSLFALFSDSDRPRAYAISSDGKYCGYATGKDVEDRALKYCQNGRADACHIYARDENVTPLPNQR